MYILCQALVKPVSDSGKAYYLLWYS